VVFTSGAERREFFQILLWPFGRQGLQDRVHFLGGVGRWIGGYGYEAVEHGRQRW
jgi:hypothetical protein